MKFIKKNWKNILEISLYGSVGLVAVYFTWPYAVASGFTAGVISYFLERK